MSREKLPPRLYERVKGQYTYWVILHAGKEIKTGADNEADAQKALGRYLLDQGAPVLAEPLAATLAHVMAIYLRDHAPKTAAPDLLRIHVGHLEPFWADRKMSDFNTRNCDAYRARRMAMKFQGRPVSMVTADKELGTLRAAMRFYVQAHGLPAGAAPTFRKEAQETPRERYLERWELCDLIKAARALGYPHLVRFLMIGAYTGTRLDAILRARWVKSLSSGHMDVEKGIFYRRGNGEKETKKRRPPCGIPPKLLWFCRKWAARDAKAGLTHVITAAGVPLEDIRVNYAGTYARTPWTRIVERAGLYSDEVKAGKVKRSTDVTPHVLRHTCATWNLLAGVSVYDVAGHIGATPTVVERVYGHHALGIREGKKVRRAA